MRIFSSAPYCLRVARRMSLMTCSAGAFPVPDYPGDPDLNDQAENQTAAIRDLQQTMSEHDLQLALITPTPATFITENFHAHCRPRLKHVANDVVIDGS